MQQPKKSEEVGSKLSDFKILKELGKGSYGTVYTVKSNINSNIYVMKKMELNHLNPRQQTECYREVSILKKVDHKNIIKYYSSFLDKEILYIIMEYAELGDLYSLIKHYRKHSKYFSEIDLWKISSEILTGLDYLHSHNIIHRDIKCLNLFITKDRHIKIGDLGVSSMSSSGDHLHYTRVGTPLYISPELVKQKPYDYKTDIWSFGCSLYHLACLEPPFTGGNLIVLGNNIVKGVPKALPTQYSNELRNFIDKMLEKKADKRPSAKEALDMIPKEILNDMKIKGEKLVIKSKRPFSSTVFGKNLGNKGNIGNKVIAINKDEIKNLFGEDTNGENDNINNKDTKQNNSNKKNEKSLKHNKYNGKDSNKRDKSEEKNKILGRNKENENNLDNINNFNFISYNDLKEKKEFYEQNIPKQKYLYDLSFNIPSFNNQKGFNNFRKRHKKHNFLFKNNFPEFTLDNKLNQNNSNNLKIFTPSFKDNSMSKKSLKQYLQQNLIEKNKTKKIINKEDNNNIINNEINNINIININHNLINEEKTDENKNDKNNDNNILVRLNTDNNQYKENHKTKFPELNKKYINNNINNTNLELNNNYINNTNSNKKPFINKTKRLSSARPLPLRPLTSKFNKNVISFKNKIHFKNDTFNNKTNMVNTKDNFNSEMNRNYTENKEKKSFRPMTGFHPQINNNIMNININFYNIDMNKRFLIPDNNPYNQNDKINSIEEPLMETKKIDGYTNKISDIDLDKYKNSNEFLFQKIIKSIQEINGNNRRLTIKDLV